MQRIYLKKMIGRIWEFCNFDLLDLKKDIVDPDATVNDMYLET